MSRGLKKEASPKARNPLREEPDAVGGPGGVLVHVVELLTIGEVIGPDFRVLVVPREFFGQRLLRAQNVEKLDGCPSLLEVCNDAHDGGHTAIACDGDLDHGMLNSCIQYSADQVRLQLL